MLLLKTKGREFSRKEAAQLGLSRLSKIQSAGSLVLPMSTKDEERAALLVRVTQRIESSCAVLDGREPRSILTEEDARRWHEERSLSASIIACELADQWCVLQERIKSFGGISAIYNAIGTELPTKLDLIESATAGSPNRKNRLPGA